MVGSRALAVAVVVAGLGVVVPAPASAAVSPCRINVACVYNADRSWMGQYSGYTDFFQQFSRRDIAYIWNRTPTAVYFNYATGVTSCASPNTFADLRHDGYGDATGIRLAGGRSCF